MKKILKITANTLVLIVLAIYVIEPTNIWLHVKRIYNGTEVQKKDYSIKLPDNWMIEENCTNQCTHIMGRTSHGFDTNLFNIALYEIGYIPNNILSKWSQCDHKTWYALTTYEGKKLVLSLCAFDFNTTTQEKPSLALNDGAGNFIAVAYDWKPYYNEEYLKIFRSIKIKEDASIVEFVEEPNE